MEEGGAPSGLQDTNEEEVSWKGAMPGLAPGWSTRWWKERKYVQDAF